MPAWEGVNISLGTIKDCMVPSFQKLTMELLWPKDKDETNIRICVRIAPGNNKSVVGIQIDVNNP